MPRLVKIAAFLLLAVWLPATLHCRIEAAGLGEPHHEGCAGEHREPSSTDCRDDICPTVEETLFKESAATLAISLPEGGAMLFHLAPGIPADRPGFSPPLSPRRQAPPPGLVATWQFDFRAAPPARAPSSLNA